MSKYKDLIIDKKRPVYENNIDLMKEFIEMLKRVGYNIEYEIRDGQIKANSLISTDISSKNGNNIKLEIENPVLKELQMKK